MQMRIRRALSMHPITLSPYPHEICHLTSAIGPRPPSSQWERGTSAFETYDTLSGPALRYHTYSSQSHQFPLSGAVQLPPSWGADEGKGWKEAGRLAVTRFLEYGIS